MAEKQRRKLTNGREAKTEIDQWQRSKDGNRPMAEKQSWNRNPDVALEQYLKIRKCFQSNKQD
jgi:hypothetical protein